MSDNIKSISISFNNGTKSVVDSGTSLMEISRTFDTKNDAEIIACKVNNDIKELSYKIFEDSKLDFIDLSNEDGMRIYRRSLYLILIKAVANVFPDRKVIMSHSLGKGIFCEVKGTSELSEADVALIESKMKELVVRAIPFKKIEMSMNEAKELLSKQGRMDRFNAAIYRDRKIITIYECDGYYDYFYGYMAPDTSYINLFELKYHKKGLIVVFPEIQNPSKLPEFKDLAKIFNVYSEHKKWLKIHGVANVSALNEIVKDGKVSDLIRISEALQEKKIAQIADMIVNSEQKKKVVLISGPSSSGKTTTANRLSIQLRVNGMKTATISLDDYFVNRDMTPRDEKGNYDFEALEALDVKLFNEHLLKLVNGEEVLVPVYNFKKGQREDFGVKKKINEDEVLVIEGIHGLNEKLTASIPKESKFKIYVSALTSINIDDHNRIPSTDSRIIRRIVRDFQFRGSDALNTIRMWASVRRGEEKNIFPFQEEADVIFNSSMPYELGVLKNMAEPLLLQIDNTNSEYSEAKRLLEFLSYFVSIDPKDVPPNSIVREFVGGSCFY